MEKIPSARDFLTIFFKHKFAIMSFFIIIATTSTVFTYVWPFTYEARAKILVKFERESVSLSGDSQNPRAILTMRQAEEEIRSEIEILKNRYLVEKVVRHLWDDLNYVPVVEQPTSTWAKLKAEFKIQLGRVIDFIYEIGYTLDLIQRTPPFQSQVGKILANLDIEVIRDSNIIEIKYKSWNPEICAKIVNTFIDFYLVRHIEVHKIRRAHDFFLSQKEQLYENLKTSEENLKNFKEKWGISAINVQKKLLLENLSQLNLENKTLKGEIEETEIQIAELKAALSKRSNYLHADNVPREVLRSDPVYKDLEKGILVNDSNLEGLKAKVLLQQKQIKGYRSEIQVLEEKQMELLRRERELDILDKDYKRYRSRLEDTRISEALDFAKISNVSVIEPATIPFMPVRRISFLPRRILHITMGMILGLFFGVAYAFLADQLDHTFHHSGDVEKILKIPCLASIPKE